MAFQNLMVFSGNANPKLAADVAERLGLPLGRADVGRFSDGEVSVEIQEHVRGNDVFVLQSTCHPSNDNLMELLVIVDALKRASAGRITAAIPYFGYARQDRRPRSNRVPIAAKLVANMLVAAGVDRVMTMDLHAEQIQGFFDIPVDNIYGLPILLEDVQNKHLEKPIVVSPDHGGVVRARSLAKRLECDLAIIDKRRPKANVSEVMNIIGDVTGKDCIIVDDLVDTAGTLERLNESVLDELVVLDTIPLAEAAQKCSRIRQLPVAELLAETIRRISKEDSVSSLFID
jgi:ribose-phosphate pyrophosphokinase